MEHDVHYRRRYIAFGRRPRLVVESMVSQIEQYLLPKIQEDAALSEETKTMLLDGLSDLWEEAGTVNSIRRQRYRRVNA